MRGIRFIFIIKKKGKTRIKVKYSTYFISYILKIDYQCFFFYPACLLEIFNFAVVEVLLFNFV